MSWRHHEMYKPIASSQTSWLSNHKASNYSWTVDVKVNIFSFTKQMSKAIIFKHLGLISQRLKLYVLISRREEWNALLFIPRFNFRCVELFKEIRIIIAIHTTPTLQR